MPEVKISQTIIDLAMGAKAFIRESGEGTIPDPLLVRAAVTYNMLTRRYGGSDDPGPLMTLNVDHPELHMDALRRAHAIAIIASNFDDHPPSTPERAALFSTNLEMPRRSPPRADGDPPEPSGAA